MIREFEVLCVFSDGKLKHLNPEMFKHGLRQFGEGEEVLVTVSEVGVDHTGAQRRFFHGPVLDAFVRAGWTRAAAKAHLCLKFIPEEFRLPDGTIIIAPGHTTDLSRKRYSELIEASIQEAAEHLGETVQDADEYRARERARERASSERRQKGHAA